MSRWRRVDGIQIESMGHLWVAFSPATGETALLNDESASILEVLEAGAADTAAICTSLATDSGIDAHDLAEIVEAAWPRLVEAGLVREQPTGQAIAQ
jgi:PqqD family protein of HPr-rel-A system